MNPVEILQDKLAKLLGETKAIEAQAAANNRVEYTPEEQAQLTDIQAEFKKIEDQIALHEANARLEKAVTAPQPRVVDSTPLPMQGAITSTPAPRAAVTGGTLVSARAANFGFTRGPAEFLGAVKNASYGRVDQRLMNAVTTYGSEGIGPDGGFAAPPDLAKSISEIVSGEGTLVSRFNPITTASNQITLPTDETTPWGTTGIYGEWLGEAGTLSPRKPALKQVTITLHKVGALVHLTDELIADAPAIQSHVVKKMGAAIASKVNEALLTGDGVAKPLGLLKAPGIVTVTDTGSGTGVFNAQDLGSMLARVPPESVGNCFWLCHSTFMPYVWSLTLGYQPVVLNDWKSFPYGMLLGKPVVVSEYCSDYNTAGDVILFSPDGYCCALKSSGVEFAQSVHFAFDQSAQSFRITQRVGGAPLAQAAITRKNGSSTLSHIVVMGARS